MIATIIICIVTTLSVITFLDLLILGSTNLPDNLVYFVPYSILTGILIENGIPFLISGLISLGITTLIYKFYYLPRFYNRFRRYRWRMPF